MEDGTWNYHDTEDPTGKGAAMKLFTIIILLTVLLALICLPEFTVDKGTKGSSMKIATLH